MSQQPIMLPQGWEARLDPQSGQYIYINQATGQSQWEPPAQPTYPTAHPSASPPPAAAAPSHRPGRRQYPTAQMAQVYGSGPGAPPAAGPGYDQATGQAPYQQDGAGFSPQFFVPGAGEQQAGQFAPAPAVPGQGYGGYGQAAGVGVDQLAGQFGHMNVGGGPAGAPGVKAPYAAPVHGQAAGAGYAEPKQTHPLQTVNLIGMQPDVRALDAPPPPALLPANAALIPGPAIHPDPSYQRLTTTSMPATASLLNKSKLPLALVLSPFRSVRESDGDAPIPVVTDAQIARCRRCRSYINPFVTFIEGGNRWKCCICGLSNEVPQLFDWNHAENKPADRFARKELIHSVVEFVAPTEYMVRPPQPLVYCFVIDVSQAAVQSGMVATAARTILESLDNIPNGDNRTKVAFIAVSDRLHFFSLPAGEQEASMLVVPDLADVFLPKPVDLLVNLTESRPAIENLLGKLSDMFLDANIVGNALGSALQAAFEMIGKYGGKIFALSASLPNLGTGALKARDDPKLLGTSKESSLLQPANNWYKSFAIECSGKQVTVDMFLFAATYTDVATLSCLPRYTAGQTYLYPGFNAGRAEDALKFATEFGKVLGQVIGLEAVIRVRATRGIRMSAFHGNFFIRSTDLLGLPTVPEDQNYVIELQIEDDLKAAVAVVQTAVLHTTCFGERRIRVVTQAVPTTDSVAELYAGADQIALATYYAAKAVEKVMMSSLDDARALVLNKLGDLLSVFKTQVAGSAGASAQLAAPANLALLPLLLCGLTKHVGLREGATISPDLRAYALALLSTLPAQSLVPYIHPRFYSLHNMPAEAGTMGEHGVVLPPALNLTSERLERHGLFLLEDGQNIFLWVGHEAVPRLIQDVFDLPSYAELAGGKTTLPQLDNPMSQRVNAIIAKTRELRRGVYRPHLYVVKSDAEPALRSWALSLLIEDRMDKMSSYAQFLTTVKNKING